MRFCLFAVSYILMPFLKTDKRPCPYWLFLNQQFHDRLVYIFHQTSSFIPRFRPHWGTNKYEQNCQSSESRPNLFGVCRVALAFDEVNCQMAFKNPFTMRSALPLGSSKNLEPLTNNVCLDGINNVPYIIIGDVWTGRQTHTYLEDCFRHTINICHTRFRSHDGIVLTSYLFHLTSTVTRLFVHGLPHWPCLYLSLVKCYTHSFYVSIRFTVSMSRLCCMDNSCRTPDCTCHDGLICILLTFHLYILIDGDSMPRGQVNGITVFVSVHVQHPSIFPVVCMMLLCPSILSTPSSLICLQAPEKRCCSLHLPSL